jgi:hypothetical protein
LASSKNPAKWLIMVFSRLKNIKSLTSKNSSTLIVILILLIFLQILRACHELRQVIESHISAFILMG